MKVKNWNELTDKKKTALLQRPAQAMSDLSTQVADILQTVKEQGDQALLDYTKRFDQVAVEELRVSCTDIDRAEAQVDDEVKQSLQLAAKRIKHYQGACLPKEITVDTQDGVVCKRRPVAIDAVGLYVPGGSAPLLSTLLMLAIPARIAGCPITVLCTPPNRSGEIDPALLLAAKICGIETIFKVGGAQAIAAMAYGTESIPKVNKIFGPGNAWVTEAKTQVAMQQTAIDMPAGPSEILVIADQAANPEFVAADLLSQAEHGPDSQVVLVTDSDMMIEKVLASVEQQLQSLSRQAIAKQALVNSVAIQVASIAEAIQVSNRYAPEHLSLQVSNPETYTDQIINAGAVFVGAWTPETMGDYLNGSNHVLPTYACANRMSGLSVSDFMKYISIQTVSQQALRNYGPAAMCLAATEGLSAHQNAVKIRLEAA